MTKARPLTLTLRPDGPAATWLTSKLDKCRIAWRAAQHALASHDTDLVSLGFLDWELGDAVTSQINLDATTAGLITRWAAINWNAGLRGRWFGEPGFIPLDPNFATVDRQHDLLVLNDHHDGPIIIPIAKYPRNPRRAHYKYPFIPVAISPTNGPFCSVTLATHAMTPAMTMTRKYFAGTYFAHASAMPSDQAASYLRLVS